MSRRRGRGEGSVYRYRGRWRAAIQVNYRRLVKDFETRREALTWLAGVRLQADRGLLPEPSRLTVGEYLDFWLENGARPAVRPATLVLYESKLRKHVVPVLGQIRLQALKPADIQALYARKLGEGLSRRSVELIHVVMRRALSQAVRRGLLGDNPADRVDRPRSDRPAPRVLSPQEAARVLQAAREIGGTVYALVATFLAAGLRLGEALGLRWEDVDLEAGELRVVRTLQRLQGRWVEGEPKTARGRRRVPIPKELAAVLKEQRRHVAELKLRAGAAWCREFGDLVFPTPSGRPWDQRNLQRALDRVLARAGLGHLRVHDLRHTHATLLLVAGVNPRVVQERLGHAQITLTLETYSHVLPELQREAAERVGRVLFGGS
jgi:integrase